MIGTRDVVRGGSSTARNQADDESFEILNSVIEEFRSNPSVYRFGVMAADYLVRKVFGLRASTSAALAEMLFTADPVQRAQVLQRVAERMGPDRVTRFTQLMQEAQRASQGAITAQTPALSASAGHQPQQ